MFWIKHPQPVRPRKAVAEQMVESLAATPMNTKLIVVDQSPEQIARMRARLGILDQKGMPTFKLTKKSGTLEG